MSIPSDAIQRAETGTSYYWERPDGIIVQRVKGGIAQNLNDARENIAVFNRMAGSTKRLILVDMRAKFSTAPGVREYYASHEAGHMVLAMALFSDSAFGRMIGNLYLTVTPPKFPTRLFTSESLAIAWLLRMGKEA